MAVRINIPFADAGDKAAIPNSNNTGYVSYESGYTVDYTQKAGTDANAKLVERSKQNTLFNLSTQTLKDWQDRAFPDWYTLPDKTEGYPITSVVRYQNNTYRSLTNNNIWNPLDSSRWELLPPQSAFISKIPMEERGTVAAPIDFNLLTGGYYNFVSDSVVINSPNSPSGAAAGLLATFRWVNAGSEVFVVQEFQSRTGRKWVRASYSAQGWTPWSVVADNVELNSRGYYYTAPLYNHINFIDRTGYYLVPPYSPGVPFNIVAAGNYGWLTTTRSNAGNIISQHLMDVSTGISAQRIHNDSSPDWGPWSILSRIVDVPQREFGIVTTPTTFNWLSPGSWELPTAVGFPDAPTTEGGWLEAHYGNVNGGFHSQRYTTLSGIVFVRSYIISSGVWTPWRGSARQPGLLVKSFAQNPPPGCLPCAGQSVSRAQYPALFAAIGTTYGSQSPTTFTLPFFETGKTVVSGSTAQLGGATNGVEGYHGHTLNEIVHTHSLNMSNHNHGLSEIVHNHGRNGKVAGFFPYRGGGGLNSGIPQDRLFNTGSSTTGITIPAAHVNCTIGGSPSNITISPSGGAQNFPCGFYIQMFIVF